MKLKRRGMVDSTYLNRDKRISVTVAMADGGQVSFKLDVLSSAPKVGDLVFVDFTWGGGE